MATLLTAVELHLIAMETLELPSNSSRNKNGGGPKRGKTTPIYGRTGVIAIAQSNDSDDSIAMAPNPLPLYRHRVTQA